MNKGILLILIGLTVSKGIYTDPLDGPSIKRPVVEWYPSDPNKELLKYAFIERYGFNEGIKEFRRLYKDGQFNDVINETIAIENNKWKKALEENSEQKQLLSDILDLENIKMLSVDKLASITSVPGCWVILAFNSSQAEKEPDNLEITKKLLGYFDEKCHVGVIDASYPSVKSLLYPFITSYPSLLIRGAGKLGNNPRIAVMTKKPHYQIRLMPPRTWGSIVNSTILLDGLSSGDILDNIARFFYEPMSHYLKMEAIYSPQDTRMDPKKVMMMKILREYRFKMPETILEFTDHYGRINSTNQNITNIQKTAKTIEAFGEWVDGSLDVLVESRLSNDSFVTDMVSRYGEQITRTEPVGVVDGASTENLDDKIFKIVINKTTSAS